MDFAFSAPFILSDESTLIDPRVSSKGYASFSFVLWGLLSVSVTPEDLKIGILSVSWERPRLSLYLSTDL